MLIQKQYTSAMSSTSISIHRDGDLLVLLVCNPSQHAGKKTEGSIRWKRGECGGWGVG